MKYSKELEYFEAVMERLHIATRRVLPEDLQQQLPDMGLRGLLGWKKYPAEVLGELFRQASENVLYRIADEFECVYYFFRLPGLDQTAALVVGPWLPFDMSRDYLQQKAAQLQIPQELYPRFEEIMSATPILADGGFLLAMVTQLAESMWGKDRFETEELNLSYSPQEQPEQREILPEEDITARMRLLEQRYHFENELIELVSRGSSRKAVLMMRRVSQLIIENRTPEPMRNAKNYGIILNTLLRKAVERGGVHPLYIDRISSDFARKIERGGSWDDFSQLLQEMILQYSAMVRRFSIGGYCDLVQQVIGRIDADLTADLSLRAHAAALNVNASYLSALFKKETGKTLTEFVMQRRMDHAAHLLSGTKLSVSEVARQCGFPDDNYFARVFRQYMDTTPRQYRQGVRTRLPR